MLHVLIPSANTDLISFINLKTKNNHRANWIFTFPFPKASQIFARQQQQVLFFSNFPNSRKNTNIALFRERRGMMMGMDRKAWLPDQTLGGNTSHKMKNTPKKKLCFSWLYKGKNLNGLGELIGSKRSTILGCS